MPSGCYAHWTFACCVQRRLMTVSTVIAVLGLVSASVVNAQSPPPTKIRVGGGETISTATPMFVALRKGMFKDAGLDVTFATVSGGSAPMAAAMKSGDIDVAIGGAIQFMEYTARGLVPGKLIGEFADNDYIILGGKDTTDVRQLKGKIFGVSSLNAGDHLYSQAVLSHFGIGPNDITWLSVGGPASRLAAMSTGKVDAMETPVSALPKSANGNTLVTADDSPVKFVSNSAFARQQFIDANKPALRTFMAVIGKATDYARTHRDDAILACQDTTATAETCQVTYDVETGAKNPFTWSSTGRLNLDAIKTMIPFLPSEIANLKNMKVDDFVDTSIASGAS